MESVASLSDHWIGKHTCFRAANDNLLDGIVGLAPHEPLILLRILDMTETGKRPGRVRARTPELTLRFRELGMLVADRWLTWLALRLPFYRLKTQGFRQAEKMPVQAAENCAVGRHLKLGPKAKRRPSMEHLRRHRLRFG